MKKVQWQFTFFTAPGGSVQMALAVPTAMSSFRKCGDAIDDRGIKYFGPFTSEAEASDPSNWTEEGGLCSHEIDYSDLEG